MRRREAESWRELRVSLMKIFYLNIWVLNFSLVFLLSLRQRFFLDIRELNRLTMLLVLLYVGPLSVINLSTYDEANKYLHQTQLCCGSND